MLSQICPRLLGGVFSALLLSGCVVPAQSTPVAWTYGTGALIGAHAGPVENTLNRGHSASSLERPLRLNPGVVSHNGANLQAGGTLVKPADGNKTASGEPSRR